MIKKEGGEGPMKSVWIEADMDWNSEVVQTVKKKYWGDEYVTTHGSIYVQNKCMHILTMVKQAICRIHHWEMIVFCTCFFNII